MIDNLQLGLFALLTGNAAVETWIHTAGILIGLYVSIGLLILFSKFSWSFIDEKEMEVGLNTTIYMWGVLPLMDPEFSESLRKKKEKDYETHVYRDHAPRFFGMIITSMAIFLATALIDVVLLFVAYLGVLMLLRSIRRLQKSLSNLKKKFDDHVNDTKIHKWNSSS